MMTLEQLHLRHQTLAENLATSPLDALVLNPGPSLAYLTGLHFHLMERPVVAIFSGSRSPAIVYPELEAAKLTDLPFEIQLFPYGENPDEWGTAFWNAALATGLNGQKVGVEPRRLRVLELRFLEAAAPEAQFVGGEAVLSSLRMYKDPQEIAAMQRAAIVAERALQEVIPLIKAGMTERELASELVVQLLRSGSAPEFPFSPIVSSGPNSANPHAMPSDRKLTAGDLLVIDFGANVDGYLSDITRTFAIGDVDPELERIAEIVRRANAAAKAKAAPGISARAVDLAARAVIEAAGYGEFFIHRTGHGLGLEGHEKPYIHRDNAEALTQGMTFTIEPGIYLPNRGGVRIEDDVWVTADGLESFTTFPRSLTRVG